MEFNRELVMHMSMEKAHSLKYRFTIISEGHKSHGKIFYQEIVTPKITEFEFGKPSVCFYMDINGESYNSFEEMLVGEGL